jgi:aminopeptidase-like protein
VDRAAEHVLKHATADAEILPFAPVGYDERQYCSPGFDLPVGCLMRSVWGTFPEYHTSADNLSFLAPEYLGESFHVCASIFDLLENNRSYKNLAPYCEPQLGRRGLYHSTGGTSPEAEINARLWVLNMSDGNHSLLDIAERSGLPFSILNDAADLLSSNGLLELASSPQP